MEALWKVWQRVHARLLGFWVQKVWYAAQPGRQHKPKSHFTHWAELGDRLRGVKLILWIPECRCVGTLASVQHLWGGKWGKPSMMTSQGDCGRAPAWHGRSHARRA